MPPPAKVELLPADLKAWLQETLKASGFSGYVQIADALNAKLEDAGLELRVGKSAVHKFGAAYEEFVKYQDEASNWAAEWMQDNGLEEEAQRHNVLFQMVTTLAFKVMQKQMVKDGDQIDPKELHFIGKMLKDIMSSSGMRYSPPFAATSYTEIVGDEQYVRALFTFGYGPVHISDLRLGDTPITEFEGVEIETREGRDTDAPITLYPRQVLEDAESVELVRPLPRDTSGNVISGPATETPVVRFTASNTSRVSAVIGFPSGLFTINDAGDVQKRTVEIRIRHRRAGDADWIDVTVLAIRSELRSAFFRQHSWDLPARGRWEVEITRLRDENTNTQASDRSFLSALQSIRPEYPLNTRRPLSLLALRIRATHQLSGALDNVNALVQRYGEIWDGTNWVEGLSRNPASACLAALTGSATPFPVPEARLDRAAFADWFSWCETKGLKYDRVHDTAQSLGEMLQMICGAGRAGPRHDGVTWGVVIDRPETLVIDHINPRNSVDFNWSRTYFDPPDGFRVAFADATNGYEQAERIVPWPGHEGAVALTEAIELPGKTDPDEIWREARRRMYELIHRPDQFSAVQDGAARLATRGDLVVGAFDVLTRTQMAARVKSVQGRLVELDALATFEAGTDYGIRFKQYQDDDDPVGISHVVAVRAQPGETTVLSLVSGEVVPTPGDVVHFGPRETTDLPMRIKGLEAGENFSSVVSMVAAARVIDTLSDADTPPAWDGRVGAVVETVAQAPGVPGFASVVSGLTGTGDLNGLQVLVTPDSASAVPTADLRIEHRLDGATGWAVLTVPVANAGADIDGYSAGETVELRVTAIAEDGTASDPSASVVHEIGAQDAALPGALEAGSIMVTGGLGHALVSIATGADSALDRIQVYRVPTGAALDRNTDATGAPFAAPASTTLGYVDGDATRTNLIANPGFADASNWSVAGGNWAIAGGVATHTAGSTSDLSQALALSDGATYRSGFDVTGRTAGDVELQLIGDTTVQASATTNGRHNAALIAPANVINLVFDASASFDGAIDNLILFQVTPACAPQGSFDYYFEPQNAQGGPGPVTGPFAASID